MPELNPEEILKVLEDQALEDEIRDVAAMSDAELHEELRAAGVDPKSAHAAAQDVARRALRAGGEQPPAEQGWVRAPPPTPRWALMPSWAALVAASISAAAVGGGTIYALGRLHHPDEPPIIIALDGSAENGGKALAQRIREQAIESCHSAQWQECVDSLTAARALDPAGDADPRVQAAWRSAQDALARPREPQKIAPDSKEAHPPPARDLKDMK